MGYTTDFSGGLTMSKPITNEQFKYINDLAGTRRMKRDVKKLMEVYNGKYGYPGRTAENSTPEDIYGIEGEFFVRDEESTGVIDYNVSPGQKGYGENSDVQPGLWCHWEIVESEEDSDQMILQWNGGEKFYNYVEWLKYLIDRFFAPWDVILNGEIEWIGEDANDRGKIVVKNNVVETWQGKITYEKQ